MSELKYVTIDSDRYDDVKIQGMFFPGGEPHVKLPHKFDGENVLLFLKMRTWNDVGIGACVIDAFCRSNASMVVAFIPYFPAARQDKTDGLSPLTLDLTWRLLVHGRHKVCVFDGHSSSRFSIAGTVYNLMPHDLSSVLTKAGVAGVIAPDKGAHQRAESFRAKFYPLVPLIECSKERDARSGGLSNYRVPLLEKRGRYIVVDDICDGGGTFNLLAEAFDNDPIGAHCELDLFVSHGIFSRGVSALSARYRHITTTDSWCQLDSSGRLTVLPLKLLFDHIMLTYLENRHV